MRNDKKSCNRTISLRARKLMNNQIAQSPNEPNTGSCQPHPSFLLEGHLKPLQTWVALPLMSPQPSNKPPFHLPASPPNPHSLEG